MNKTLAIFVALTLVVSAVSIALVVDDAQAGKNKPPKVRGTNGADGGGNGDNGGSGTNGGDGNDGNSGTNGGDATGING